MAKITRLLSGLLLITFLYGCGEKTDSLVVISTPYGEMKAVLYEETPKHKANFIKLAESGKFDDVIFHRVIEDFMIQTGDLSTGTHGEEIDYKIDAEFLSEKYFHEKGALAAARFSGPRNPQKQSDGSQFYIVDGVKYDEEGLKTRGEYREYLKLYDYFERLMRLDRYLELKEKYNYHVSQYQEDTTYDYGTAIKDLVFRSKEFIDKEFGEQTDPGYNQLQQERYASIGGAPHLDSEYTVFGRVVEGLEVIDKIAAVETNYRDKPLEDIRITIRLEELTRTEMSNRYGMTYPDK